MEETVDGYWRGGYKSQTSHSSSHNPCDYFKFLCISVDSRHVGDILHDNIRGDIRVDNGRRVSSSKEIRHSSFKNDGEIVDGDGRSGYMYHIIPSPFHNPGNLGRSLGFYINSHKRSVHRSQISQFSSYNHGGLYIFHPSSPQEAILRGVKGYFPHQNHPYYSYTIMPPHPHKNIPPRPYTSMPPHPIFYLLYCTSTPMYVPYVVAQNPHITYLGYLHRKPMRPPS